MIHSDPNVDKAMRANMGKGYHFFDPDNQRFHRSRSVAGVESRDGRFVFVVERYRTATMGGVTVQTPHSRVVRVDLTTGETDYMTEAGLPCSEMLNDGEGPYRNNGEACHYSTNARAMKAARSFALDQTFALYWMPEGKRIATVRAASSAEARKMAPKPYRKFLGEIATGVVDP